MTIRKLLMKLALHLVCLASGGVDVAADAASTVATALAGGQRIEIELEWVGAWAAIVPFECPCLSRASTPLARACAND